LMITLSAINCDEDIEGIQYDEYSFLCDWTDNVFQKNTNDADAANALHYISIFSTIAKQFDYSACTLFGERAISPELRKKLYWVTRIVSLIERYIKKSSGLCCKAEALFDIASTNQLILEQFINASEGNMRRLVHLLDSSMNIAYVRCQGTSRVSLEDVINALCKQGEEMESQYQDMDKNFLISLAKVCKSRSTYNFTFPNKSTLIGRYTNTSSEYNVVNIKQIGTGRQGTVYSFDYAYCVYRDIPTHYVKDSEKIDRTRSTQSGEAIKRVAQLTDEVLIQADIRGKIEGTITYLSDGNRSGFVTDSEGNEYYINMNMVIASDKKKRFHNGDHVRFLPQKVSEDLFRAVEVEIL